MGSCWQFSKIKIATNFNINLKPFWKGFGVDFRPNLVSNNVPKYVLNLKSPIATKYCKYCIRIHFGRVQNETKIESKIA